MWAHAVSRGGQANKWTIITQCLYWVLLSEEGVINLPKDSEACPEEAPS